MFKLIYPSMAMRYWLALTTEEQWGFEDSRRLHWVEKHMFNLIGSRKYKGAILFGRKLLTRARELTPVLGQSVSRLTYRVVYCLCVLDKVDEAEEAVCKLLEMPRPEKEVDEVTRGYLLYTLHELATAMQRNGRTVEAEGLYRYNIYAATMSEIKSLSGTEKYDTWQDCRQLIMCLVEQGKVREAKTRTAEYQVPDLDEDSVKETVENTLSAYGWLKQLYARTIEAEMAGTMMELRAAIDVADLGHSFKRAIRLFGNVKRRVAMGRDFESDIDLHHIARARDSRLLRLLDFPFVYLSFTALREIMTDADYNEYLWANRRQSILGQYWKWCDCRIKRRRSQSIDELHDYFDRPAPDDDLPPKPLKQKLITDWITRSPVARAPLDGCSPSCVCIEANKRGMAERADWESKLLVWEEPVEELSKKRKKPKPRYRKTKPNKLAFPEDEVFVRRKPGNSWLWIQSEFAMGEDEDENYILSRATDLPKITINPPDGQLHLDGLLVEPQQTLARYFQPDYAADFARVLEKHKENPLHPDLRQQWEGRLEDVLDDEDEEVVDIAQIPNTASDRMIKDNDEDAQGLQ